MAGLSLVGQHNPAATHGLSADLCKPYCRSWPIPAIGKEMCSHRTATLGIPSFSDISSNKTDQHRSNDQQFYLLPAHSASPQTRQFLSTKNPSHPTFY